MPTWQHILIAALIPISFLLGGSFFFLVIGQLALAVLVPIPLAVLFLYAFMKSVPAKCPECGGKAYLRRSKEKKFYYECVNCGLIENKECSLDE